MGERTAVRATALAGETVALLGELIRLDTVNPPGNERAAQELLAQHLREAGFTCELLAADPQRPNLVATLPGGSPGPTLTLLGHVDTVPAEPSEWSFDPWIGDVVDGEVRGRGAQDMKGQVAAEVAAVSTLAREGWRPVRGELKVVLTADEERGAALGAAWLCAEHPEAVRSDFVVNEGGGAAFEFAGKRFYPLCVGEKGVNRFVLRAGGAAGHGSVPALGDNALLRMAPALARLGTPAPVEPYPEGLAFLGAVLGTNLDGADATAAEAAVEELRAGSPRVAELLADPMLRVTFVPTQARASEKVNVIPSVAQLTVDCRVPPGFGAELAAQRLDELLGPLADELEVEFVDRIVGNTSPAASPLADAIAAWLAAADPEAALVPTVMPGFSDSHWFRKAFGSAVVYGFCPQRELGLVASQPLVHAADERAAVADLELAAGFFRDLCTRMLG